MKKIYLLVIFLISNISTAYCSDIISITYNTQLEQLSFAVNNLKEQLFYKGKQLQINDINNPGLPDLVIITKGDIQKPFNTMVTEADFDGLKSEGYLFKRTNNNNTLLVLASDEKGAAYGMLELKEHLELNPDLKK
jgi:hypothetical protein